MRKGTPDIKSMDFIKRRQLLRQYYKRWKVGLILFEEIPEEYQLLLQKYYGVGK